MIYVVFQFVIFDHYCLMRISTNKRYVQLLAMAQTGKKLESWATEEDKKINKEMKEADKTMRRTAKELGIKNPIIEIHLEVEF